MSDSPAEGILRYHEQTKHHPDRYARSLGYMDYDNQPNPFRVLRGRADHNPPRLSQDPRAAPRLYEPTRPRTVDRYDVAGFLELSMGLSAWKAVSGSRWSLRMNPSSGNLHPTETHLILPPRRNCDAASITTRRCVTPWNARRDPGELWRSVRRAARAATGFWSG